MKEKQSKAIMDAVRDRLQDEVEKGRTISAIAETSNIDRTQLSRYLKGERSLPTEQWLRLASTLEVTLVQLDDETSSLRQSSTIGTKRDALANLRDFASQLSDDEKTVLALIASGKELEYELLTKKLKNKKLAKAIIELVDLRLLNYS